MTLILVGILLGATALFALFAVYAERKVSAFIQNRMGPMEVGPYGLLQTLADILKLIFKENVVAAAADRRLFLAAPVIVFVSVFAGMAVLPFGPDVRGADLNVGVLYLAAVVSVDVIGVLMAGWASNNKYALLGAVRSVSQIISYEVPAGLALLAAVAMYGSLHLNEIALAQGVFAPEPARLLGAWDTRALGGFFSWGIIRYPHLLLAFLIYYIAALAECNRAPFDLPEAESELISGFHTEYSGFRFAVLFLAEYANMLLTSLLAAILFLGGWNTPVPNLYPVTTAPPDALSALMNGSLAYLTSGTPGTASAVLWGAFWLTLKGCLLVFVQMWIRWTYPRLRPDQLMTLCWKYLTPFALGATLISSVWKLAEVYSFQP